MTLCLPTRAVLDKSRIFMLEWSKQAASAGPEGTHIEHINDWFACMTADAVVKVGCRFGERTQFGFDCVPRER
jgi:hypothetical protein